MIKRWYRHLIYRLYVLAWTPVYEARPDLLKCQIKHMQAWLDRQAEVRRPDLRLVKGGLEVDKQKER